MYSCRAPLIVHVFCYFVANDECGFQPMVQSKEYYLSNFDRESSSNGYTYWVSTCMHMSYHIIIYYITTYYNI